MPATSTANILLAFNARIAAFQGGGETRATSTATWWRGRVCERSELPAISQIEPGTQGFFPPMRDSPTDKSSNDLHRCVSRWWRDPGYEHRRIGGVGECASAVSYQRFLKSNRGHKDFSRPCGTHQLTSRQTTCIAVLQGGGETRNRTGDTRIFSPAFYSGLALIINNLRCNVLQRIAKRLAFLGTLGHFD
jgi:hypothetical protein